MRIVASFTHPRLKLTLMEHGRYILKAEDRDVELSYRWRSEELPEGASDVQRLLDLGLLQDIERTLAEMNASRRRYLPRPTQSDFPQII